MKVPLSWLKDFVTITLPLDELAHLLTMIGLEVEEVHLVGLPAPDGERPGSRAHEFKFSGLAWEPDKIVVGSISEVLPHPNADRLVLCTLDDGQQVHTVLTGAPNLFPYKGKGPLQKPLKVAYAREGARLYDGHQPGQVLTTLKRTKIRGVESYSMVCSEKELGISEEHEGILFLDEDAPTGMALSEYIGDAVFEISILPNMIRNACILGVAREVAAATGQKLHTPPQQALAEGAPIAGAANIEIRVPELNPRFVVGLIRDTKPAPSPYRTQVRLRLAGMRPINSIVDATNYVMLEVGQPLHAFDYDKLVQRAGGSAPTIITRTAAPGERLKTLDEVDRALDPFTVLVCDTAGALSIAGVMGGAETEVSDDTRNVLLEGAAWNFINIRKTVAAQKLQSEAAYRYSRGIHPAMTTLGVQLGLERMRVWGGGVVSQGMVDNYPLPVVDPLVEVTSEDVRRLLGIELSPAEIADILSRLEFACRIEGGVVYAQTPPHRLDIGQGVTGKADVLEEVARIYGYDRIPGRRLPESLPPQRGNPSLEAEERVRDLLIDVGLQEVISYRMTSPEREARLLPVETPVAEGEYVRLQNPISPDRSVMRRSLLSSVLEALERNLRLSDHLALFEIGPVFLPQTDQALPDEPRRLAIVLSGVRTQATWDLPASGKLDFYDLKAILEALLEGLHIQNVAYEPAPEEPSFHPGKCARLRAGEKPLGVFGELHPLVKERYDFGEAPVLAADLDLEGLLASLPENYTVRPVPTFPAVLEDIAIIVAEGVPAAQVEALIRQSGNKLLTDVRLFDIFRGEQIGAGRKSLAYRLTYQAPDRTLTDGEAAQIRGRIVRRLEQELGAKLREG